MISISQNHLQTLETIALRRFEDQMLLHCKEFSPRLSKVLGDKQLYLVLDQTIKRSIYYGLTFRGPMRLYIELTFLYGSGFGTDPQYPKIKKILNATEEQILRADKLYKQSLDYHNKVAGKNNANVHAALLALSIFAKTDRKTFGKNNFTKAINNKLTASFPQKVAYLGENRLNLLIEQSIIKAQKYGFSDVRGMTLITILMFAFGHHCTNDPLYPWISHTLEDPKIKNSQARIKRLEKKAITWLNHVLSSQLEK